MGEPRRVILVGHCGPDAFMLKSAVGRFLPGADIASANSRSQLDPFLAHGSVLLVNRVLDGDFGTESGIDLIRDLAVGEHGAISMLISNYEDAQQEAVRAGARPGFGKTELFDERTATLLREAAGATESA